MSLSVENQSALLDFASKKGITAQTGFKNFTQNVIERDAVVLDIENRESLKQVLAYINAINKDKPATETVVLRAAAGGKKELGHEKEYSQSFSLTPCASGDVIVRLVGPEFQKIEVLDKEKNLVQVGAGVQIGDLDHALYDEHKLCLPTSSLIPYVTLVGLIANAGHGTGRDQPSVAGLIRAMTICRPDGKIVRIDKENHPDFETIRASHLGLFGVVLSVEIECAPAAKLQCVKEARSVNALCQDIKNGLFHDNDYVSVMYVPTYQPDERNEKNVTVIRWKPVGLDVETTNSCPLVRDAEQELSIKISDLFNVPGFLAHHSHLIPLYMKHLVARIEVGSKDTLSVAPWPDVAHYQVAFPSNLEDTDYLFATKKNCEEIIKAIDRICEKLAEYAARKQKQFPITEAIYIRFLKGTNGGLSTSQTNEEKTHICGLDIVTNRNIPGYADFKVEMDRLFFEELGAVPHWGKTVDLNKNYAELYGKRYDEFKKVLDRWYEQCGLSFEKSIFLNPFFRSILQVPASPMLAERHQQDAEAVEKKVELPTLSLSAREAAQNVLSHLAQHNLDSAPLRELKAKLEQFVQPSQIEAVNFTDSRRREGFLKSIGAGAGKKQEKNQEEENTSCVCSCAIS